MTGRFLRFCVDKFKLLMMASRISDTRKKPKIPMSTIVLLMVISLALGQRSFHQIDILARKRPMRRLLGSRRDMAASDTTLERVVPTIDLEEVREELQVAYIQKKQRNATITLTSGRRIRVGVVDGYETGSGKASCLQVLGGRSPFLLDAEPYEKDGKELPSSTTVIQRAATRHGRGCIEIALGDPLYVSGPFWTACRNCGIHTLVKGETAKKEDLTILREARALCAAGGDSPLVERAQGTDPARGVSYTVSAVRGLKHDSYAGTVKVALVEETRLKHRKGKKANLPNVSAFWVIATDESLTPEEMRELGHLRWTIENQGFRSLNAHLGSKGTWTRGKSKKEMFPVLLLLMFLAFNLASEFETSVDVDDIRREFGQSKESAVHAITLRLVVECILAALETAEPLVANV